MSDEMLARLVDEMAEFTKPFFFSPFKVNEPFLDKRLIPLLQTINERIPLARLRLFSNGSPLTIELLQSITALTRVEHLWISLNSHDATRYDELMGIPFARTVARLDNLHSVVASGLFHHPVVVSKVTEDDPRLNLDFVFFVRARWPLFTPFLIKRDGWLGYVTPGSEFIPQQPCARWYDLSVMATGEVALCCMDGSGEFAIGDLNKQTMLEVYNSPFYQSHRATGVTRQRFNPCARCTY